MKKNYSEDLKKVEEKSKGFIGEFKKFIMKGNVMDLAVGVLIGGAFQSIVTSLIKNIISPIVGMFSVDGFAGIKIHIFKADLMIGQFVMDIVNFIIMSFVVFLIVKAVNSISSIGKKEEKVETKKSDDVVLLEEILAELKKKNK